MDTLSLGISPGYLLHIYYNLRRSNIYRGMTRRYTKTKPVVSRIGERVRPDPKGQPGYIRIDTVHQGDFSGQKGVYHINSVDGDYTVGDRSLCRKDIGSLPGAGTGNHVAAIPFYC